MSRTYASPEEFASRFGADLGGLLTRVLDNAQELATDVLHEAAPPRTPVGSGRDKHPGQLLASLGLVRADGLAPNEVGFGGKGNATYAAVINRGRKRSKPYSFTRGGATVSVKGRMLGSKQSHARRGQIRGMVRELRRRWDSVVEAAIGKAGGA